MKKSGVLLLALVLSSAAFAQKIESIAFHLYTDSLKKGFYNYINVDGLLKDSSWQPLDARHLILSCNTGYFRGNDLFIDSSYHYDTVTIKAILKSNHDIWKEITVYIRKRGFNQPLKTNEDLINEMQRQRRSGGGGRQRQQFNVRNQ